MSALVARWPELGEPGDEVSPCASGPLLREAYGSCLFLSLTLRGAEEALAVLSGVAWVLMAVGLVDRVQVTLFPVLTGQSGTDAVFGGATDFDLELIEHRTLDGHTQELVYRPTLH